MRRVAAAFLAVGALAGCAGWFPSPPDPPPDPDPVLVYDPPADLPAPEGLIALDGQYREIPLRWDPVLSPSVAGYLLEIASSAEGPFRARATLHDRGTLAWVDHSEAGAVLGDGATRFYRLRSFSHDLRVSDRASNVASATTAPLPAPPEKLRAYSRQPRSVPLVWDAAADPIVAGYTVERSPGPDGPFEVVAELDGHHTTHLLDKGLGDLRVLFYRVSSRNPGGERGPPSNVVRAVTKPPPLPPVSLHLADRSLGAVTLAWEPNVERDLRGYRVERWRGDGPRETVATVGASETRAEDPAVGPAEVFSYAVVAIDEDGLESRPSRPIQVTGLDYEWIATAASGGVRLRWNPRREEGYVRARVTRSQRLRSDVVEVTEDDELLDRAVDPGRQYRYQITLEREDGEAAPPSRPIAVEVPRIGEPFVEIQPPASRMTPPEDVPR
jgi:fibronectin type 3 domain-containing protein